MPNSTALNYAEVQEQIYDHVESIKDKFAYMLLRPLPIKQMDSIKTEISRHLDALITSVSDL